MLRSGPQKNEDVLQVEAAARPDQTPMELCKRGRRDIADLATLPRSAYGIRRSSLRSSSAPTTEADVAQTRPNGRLSARRPRLGCA